MSCGIHDEIEFKQRLGKGFFLKRYVHLATIFIIAFSLILSTSQIVISDVELHAKGPTIDIGDNRAEQVTGLAYDDNMLKAPPVIETSSPTELFFQVQDSIPGYKNLNNESFEPAIQEASTEPIAELGDYRIMEKWVSDILLEPANIGGIWEFEIYGYISNTSLADGFLYAKVFELSTDELLFETGKDDENICAFESYHNYSWTYDVPEQILDAGDRYYVEIWLSVTSNGLLYDHTLNPDFDTGSTNWTFNEWEEGGYAQEFWNESSGNPGGAVVRTFLA